MWGNTPLSSVFCKHFFPALAASFTEQKLFILMRSSVSALCVTDRVSGVMSEKLSPHPGHLGFLVHCLLGASLSILNLG